jgi:hypothetical protein
VPIWREKIRQQRVAERERKEREDKAGGKLPHAPPPARVLWLHWWVWMGNFPSPSLLSLVGLCGTRFILTFCHEEWCRFNQGSWCHFLSLRNALKGLATVADTCRRLPRSKLGMALSEAFCDRMNVFDMRRTVIDQLVPRSGEAFLVRNGDDELVNAFFEGDQDSSDTLERLLAASSVAGSRAEEFAEIFLSRRFHCRL